MQSEKRKNLLLVILIATSVLTISLTFYFYQVFFSPNTMVESDQAYMLKIPGNAVYKQVSIQLYDDKVINDAVSFGFVAKVLGYQEDVKPGLYKIEPK